jgi:soluble lytic murein transglycosylase-like protein
VSKPKAIFWGGQGAQNIAPLRVDDAIQPHVAEADWRAGQSVQKMTPPRADDAIRSHVAEASRRFRIPADWIWAVMQAESAGDVRARSKKGAMGLMQIMPTTWTLLRERHGLGDDPFDPRDWRSRPHADLIFVADQRARDWA